MIKKATVTSLFSFALLLSSTHVHAAKVECEKLATAQASDTQVLSAYAFATQIDPDKLRNYIQYLNGERALWGGYLIQDRKTETNREVVRWAISHTLAQMGYRTEYEQFKDGANIILEIPGSTLANEVLELGAHYDTEDSGADDNGAGIALLIHLAELLKSNPPQRTVRLVFYDLEETGGFGSKHHAQQLKKNDPRKFITALVVDSIGYYPKNLAPRVLTAEIGDNPERVALARELFYQLRRLPVDRGGIQVSAETDKVDGEIADHGSYWDAGIPAILIARPYDAKFDSPYNHGPHDTTQNMNWDYYTAAAKIYAELAASFARVQVNPELVVGLPQVAQEDLTFSLASDAGQTLPGSLLSSIEVVKPAAAKPEVKPKDKPDLRPKKEPETTGKKKDESAVNSGKETNVVAVSANPFPAPEYEKAKGEDTRSWWQKLKEWAFGSAED